MKKKAKRKSTLKLKLVKPKRTRAPKSQPTESPMMGPSDMADVAPEEIAADAEPADDDESPFWWPSNKIKREKQNK